MAETLSAPDGRDAVCLRWLPSGPTVAVWHRFARPVPADVQRHTKPQIKTAVPAAPVAGAGFISARRLD